MMSVWFGDDSTSTKHVDLLFKYTWDYKYLQDEFIRMVLAYVDSCKVSDDGKVIISPVFGYGMPAEYLSGGAKCLILLYILPKEKFRPNIVICGLNCSAPLARLSLIKDINVSLSNCTMHFAGYGIKEIAAYCENDGTYMKNDDEWGDKVIEFYDKSSR